MASRRCLFSLIDTGGGRYLAAGGIDDLDLINQGTPTNTAEMYDPVTGSWSPVASMVAARGLHSAFEVGHGRFLHIMGADGSLLMPNSLATTEIYDVGSDTWSAGPTSPTPRAAYGAYANGHGQIHVLGGSDGSTGPLGGVTNSSSWVYR